VRGRGTSIDAHAKNRQTRRSVAAKPTLSPSACLLRTGPQSCAREAHAVGFEIERAAMRMRRFHRRPARSSGYPKLQVGPLP
jgi:hypothetical protein